MYNNFLQNQFLIFKKKINIDLDLFFDILISKKQPLIKLFIEKLSNKGHTQGLMIFKSSDFKCENFSTLDICIYMYKYLDFEIFNGLITNCYYSITNKYILFLNILFLYLIYFSIFEYFIFILQKKFSPSL